MSNPTYDRDKIAGVIAAEWAKKSAIACPTRLYYRDGFPTLDTLRANGKIHLIDYKNDEPVTERPRKLLNT